jgi:L-ascorbate metabolism protein UlaG (beta-lactamase superfamily)
MPEIDILLLTHDHYDHLDYHTILQLASKTKHICTSLGVGAHLEAWGIPVGKIIELDWWESDSFTTDGRPGAGSAAGTGSVKGNGFTFTATPARHFSGRSFKRAGTLWSGFVLKTGGYSLFLGGDSGYGEHFKTIGDRFGPFDLAILESGQYGKNWPYIHMLPEQTVQAALDLRAAALLPVHWAKFTLALHPWNEPIRRVTVAAKEKGMPIATPLIGQPFPLKGPYPDAHWWE